MLPNELKLILRNYSGENEIARSCFLVRRWKKEIRKSDKYSVNIIRYNPPYYPVTLVGSQDEYHSLVTINLIQLFPGA